MEQTHLLADLGLLLVAALGGGIVAYLLRQPLIVGYILGGILVSPFTPGPQVPNPQAFETFADIGVVLLMFSIGVEFSLHELLRVRKVAVFGAPAGIILIILMAFLTGTLLGWPLTQRLVVGATISARSTMVLVRFLQDRGEVNSTHGRIVVGIALVGDLAVVAMIVLLPALNPAATNQLALLLQPVLKGALILGPFFLLARRVVPGLLARVARTGNMELLVLVMMALAIGTAVLTRAAGLSIALGAFLAGLLVNESESCHDILTRILPIRDIFVGHILRVHWSARPASVSSVADSHDHGLGASCHRRELLDLARGRAGRRVWGRDRWISRPGVDSNRRVFLCLSERGPQGRADRYVCAAGNSRNFTHHNCDKRAPLSPYAELAEAHLGSRLMR